MKANWRVVLWAGLTSVTLLYAGMWHWVLYASTLGERWPLWSWDTAAHGLWYAGGIGVILMAHECGHLLACEAHGLQTTGPYFLPSPFALIGTFGAFIRVHTPYPSRRALMHVGIAGPLVGFIVAVLVLIAGLMKSETGDLTAWPNVIRFGQPVILTVLSHFTLGDGPLYLHPLAIAAWVGLLFTMLNLVPFRQFDGGHIVRAAFGQKVGMVLSWMSFLVAVYLSTKSITWAAMAIVMALDGLAIVDRTVDDEQPNFRWGYVAVAALIFALCWNQIDV